MWNNFCRVSAESDKADLLRKADLLIWDEAAMSHRHNFESVDRMLRDLMRKEGHFHVDLPFGGKTILFGGDFRQCLPIIKHGSRGDIVKGCLHRSLLWDGIRRFQLHTNMRAQLATDPAEASAALDWAAFLTRIGDGTEPTVPQVIDLLLLLTVGNRLYHRGPPRIPQ